MPERTKNEQKTPLKSIPAKKNEENNQSEPALFNDGWAKTSLLASSSALEGPPTNQPTNQPSNQSVSVYRSLSKEGRPPQTCVKCKHMTHERGFMTVLCLGVTPLATNKCWGVNGVHPTVVIRCGGHSVDNLLSGAMACHRGTRSHWAFAWTPCPIGALPRGIPPTEMRRGIVMSTPSPVGEDADPSAYTLEGLGITPGRMVTTQQ